MTRSLIPLFALTLLLGACSSTQSAHNINPVPAQAAGSLETRWGSLPTYTCKEGNAVVLKPQEVPVPRSSYGMELDLLVDRDGTVKDVSVRKSSGIPEVDAVASALFKESRSRLVLAPSDPAPYVLHYVLARNVENTATNYNRNDYHFVDDRPMGQGEPLATDRR